MSILAPIIVGIHLTSVHYAMPENSSQGDYNNVNPGIYARWESGLILGAYYNSNRATSIYVAKAFDLPIRKTEIIVGGITGYSRKPILPLIAVSYSRKFSEQINYRITACPPSRISAGVIHFSIERNWK